MDDVKSEFAKHLAGIGFELSATREVILEKLRKRMGEERFKKFQSRQSHSAASQEEFYSLFQDIVEGNLMRSLDTGATLDASLSLYQRCAPRIESGMRIMELGCWTGGLASFIATRHPNCSVAGVDLSHDVVKACREFYSRPNLGFQRWNYRWAKPDEVEPADVLLCAMGVVHHMPNNGSLPDPRSIRRCPEYKKQLEHAIGYFGMWRSAAKDGAVFYAALRLGLFARFLAWIDAAQEAGWTPRLDRMWHVDMTGEKHPLPGLMFEAQKCDPLPEEAIIDRWAWFSRRDHLYACVEGAPALAAFRAFTDKKVIGTREYRHKELLTRDEVGVAAGTGYAFTQDAVSGFRLLLVSRARAEELAAGISAKGSNAPISNDGWFQLPPKIVPAVNGVFACGATPSTARTEVFSSRSLIACLAD